MNVNPAAALSLVTSLYEQLAAAHAEIEQLRATQQSADSEQPPKGFVPCDPHDGPAR